MSDKVVIFDGECMLCNSALSLLIKIDRHKVLRYTSLQGEYVKRLNLPNGMDSIIFYNEGQLYTKSTAILKILSSLGGVWVVVNVSYVIPVGMRDYLYDIVAKYRYTFFGKMESCRMPKEEEKALFIP